jgi:hypothetical protein
MRLSDEKKALVTALQTQYGDVVTRKQVLTYTEANGLQKPRWLFNNIKFRAGRGTYDLTKVSGTAPAATTNTQPTAA